MIEGSCKEKIRGRIPRLTSTEAKIANYIVEHFDDVLSLNVAELAKEVGVSDASVVRFSRSVGFKGFQDLKMNMARDILPHEKEVNPILVKGDDTEAICRKIFASEENVLHRTLMELDLEVVERAAAKIGKARKVVMFGTGGSQKVVQDAQHKFLKVGYAVTAHEDIDLQLMESALMTKEDVAVCISFSGNNSHVLECMKTAHSKGAYCLGIISLGKSAVSKQVDDVLYASYDETIFQSESVSTRIAQLAIIDCLVSCVAMTNYEYARRSINHTREATITSKY